MSYQRLARFGSGKITSTLLAGIAVDSFVIYADWYARLNLTFGQTRGTAMKILFLVFPLLPATWFLVVEVRKQFSHRVRKTRALLQEAEKETRIYAKEGRAKDVDSLANLMWRITQIEGLIEDALSYRRFEDFKQFKAAEERRAKESDRKLDVFVVLADYCHRAASEIVTDDCRTDFFLPEHFAQYDSTRWNDMKKATAKAGIRP